MAKGMIKKIAVLFCLSLFVVSCAHQPQPVVVEHPPQEPPHIQQARAKGADVSTTFSNESVTIFSLDSQPADWTRQTNQYRGVLENTTAGGYTVFDPSVTVFALNQQPGVRPAYLPDYSVPKYAAQYRSQPPVAQASVVPTAITPLPQAAPQQRTRTRLLTAPAQAPQPVVQARRRSGPILTSYE